MAIELKITLSDEQAQEIARYIVNGGMLDKLLEKKELPLDQQYLSVKEVAGLTGQTTTTIHSHIKKGLLKAKKLGGLIKITRQDLKDYANGE
ncbi:excisionase family DNA-binding protein [Myroides odoratimimus]|uniref:helix-turn-helix domain-containing protein n=1 Tax=Myroides odoratimimus TaxID=76832 RepID=UPI002576E751|nr:helix-turn-helix domain-containing protein [Myroides odoratimimus]MDM1505382.1 excisionase family DNA-binding protein [Myroides odoratimimus]MDM1515809.1 excisionase family DNA-binding protein [Myroides odoratimimus]